MQPNLSEVDRIIEMALAEDIGQGDITSNLTIPADRETEFHIRARQKMVVCGGVLVCRVFKKLSQDMTLQVKIEEGAVAAAGDVIICGKGNARAVLAGERVVLNLLRQMCGVATQTRDFADAVKGTKARILDTRKTIPGLRILQKYAVTVGGGYNHRFRLDDGVLIKDNHISVCGSITRAVEQARDQKPALLRIEVECDTLEQVKEAIAAKADVIMLDNMDIATMQEAVKLADGAVPLEASGNVSLQTVAAIAQTGVDFISAGVLTNAPYAVDIGLDIDL